MRSNSAREHRPPVSNSRSAAAYASAGQGSSGQYAQELPSSSRVAVHQQRPTSASGPKQSHHHQSSGNKEPYPVQNAPLSHFQSYPLQAAAPPSATHLKPPAAQSVGRTLSSNSNHGHGVAPFPTSVAAPPIGAIPSSSSSTKQKDADGRNVLSRMFSRRRATSSSAPQAGQNTEPVYATNSGDKDRSRSSKHQRSSSMQVPGPSYAGATGASSSSYPQSQHPQTSSAHPQTAIWNPYEHSAPTPKPTNYSMARDSDREDRDRERERDKERTKLRKSREDKERPRDRDREREREREEQLLLQQQHAMRDERARMERSRDERARQEYLARRATDPSRSSKPTTSRRERDRDITPMSDSDARAYDSSDSTRRRHMSASAAGAGVGATLSGAVPLMSHRPHRSDEPVGPGSSHVRDSIPCRCSNFVLIISLPCIISLLIFSLMSISPHVRS